MSSAQQNTVGRDSYISLVGKVVSVLEALREAPEGLSLQQLAARTGYVPSSVHRILASLKRHGYVQQDAPGTAYTLGLQLLGFARAMRGSFSLARTGRVYLRELVTRFNESTYLAVLHGDRGIFVDVQETSRDLRLVGPIGADVHFHATAAGKAMAAHFPAPRRAAILATRPRIRLTHRTMATRAEVEREWARVRRTGAALNNEETIVGAVFLAAPIFDASRAVCGAISVGIPKARYSASVGRGVARALRESCARLSATLMGGGYVHDAGDKPEPATEPDAARRLAG